MQMKFEYAHENTNMHVSKLSFKTLISFIYLNFLTSVVLNDQANKIQNRLQKMKKLSAKTKKTKKKNVRIQKKKVVL